MRRLLQPTALLAAFAAAAALAACGTSNETTTSATTTAIDSAEVPAGGAPADEADSGETAGPSDEQQVRAAIEALLIDPDNEFVCGEVLSEKLLRTAYGDLQGCLDGRGGPTLAESARINGLAVEGATASATAVPEGGLYDGEDLEIEAVDVGGEWRIDRFVADIPVGP